MLVVSASDMLSPALKRTAPLRMRIVRRRWRRGPEADPRPKPPPSQRPRQPKGADLQHQQQKKPPISEHPDHPKSRKISIQGVLRPEYNNHVANFKVIWECVSSTLSQ